MSTSEEPTGKPNFWVTLPGILTAVAALITATAGLVAAVNALTSGTTPSPIPTPLLSAAPSQGYGPADWAVPELTALGYSTAVAVGPDTLAADSVGRYQDFNIGRLYQAPDESLFLISTTFLSLWNALPDSTPGPVPELGYPLSNSQSIIGKGRYQLFEHGAIYCGSMGCHEIHEPIWKAYLDYKAGGAENNELGFPTTNVKEETYGLSSLFENGFIKWDSATGQTLVCPKGMFCGVLVLPSGGFVTQ